MTERNSKLFAITCSKFNRGSMTQDEIKETVQYLGNTLFKDSLKLFIVNEHNNKLGQDFEHLHIFVELKEDRRSDNITQSIKKNLTFFTHKKDILTKICISDGWKEYISKSSDRIVLLQKGITDEDIQNWETDYKAKVQTVKEIKKVVKNRIFKSDLPTVMYNYITDIGFEYNCTLSDFMIIVKDMLRNNYDFEIKGKMMETKAKLDLYFDDDYMLLQMMEDEYRFVGIAQLGEDYLDISKSKLRKCKENN